MDKGPYEIIRKACQKIKRGDTKFTDKPLLEKVYQAINPSNKILKTKF